MTTNRNRRRNRTLLASALLLLACSSENHEDEFLAEKWAALTVSNVDATVALQSDWKSGYCADVIIKNNGAVAIKDWQVELNLRQSTINNVWNGTAVGNKVTPVAHNITVNPGQSVNFGFCANATGTDYLPAVSGLTFQTVGGSGTGGSTSTGGASSTGGATSSGGTVSTGGTTSTGGVTSTGGSVSTGGTATGGRPATGGTTSTGGSVASGGTTSTGGSTTTGGSTSTGGTTNTGSASIKLDSDWGSGYCATVTTGSSNWRVVVNLNNSELNNLWNGTSSVAGSTLTVTGTASSFGFCARALAATNYRPTLVGGSTGTGGATSSGGSTSTGGATSSGGSTSTGGSSGGGTGYPPITNGCSGYATRFWDCCKPHCGWPGNVPGGVSAMNSCSASNQELSDDNTQSACSGGSAHTCYGLTPIEINDNLSYGYAATSSGDVCGRCYQIQFTGSSHNGGSDPGSAALAGKTMIVQAINIGYDVGGGQFDLLIPGGGVGAFNACSAQWGVSNSELGAQYGGFLSACKSQLGNNATGSAYKSCVANKCDSVFKSRGLNDLATGCHWFADWFEAADNPALKYKEVACPAELTGETGMNRSSRNDISNACGN